jgi:hypothetical protein
MAKTRGKMRDVHRAFLVRELACFASPSEAVNAVKDQFGIDITMQAVEHYDPTKKAGQKTAKKWAEMFAMARQAFIEEVSESVPFAHRSVRIKELAHAANQFKRQKNYIGMARILEQIAKEVGNVHTNRHEFTGKNGGPIQYMDTGDMTDEQIINELAELGVDASLIHPAPKMKQ